MNKYQIVLTDGSVKVVEAATYTFDSGFVIFHGPLVTAFAISTVKLFSQLPAGAA